MRLLGPGSEDAANRWRANLILEHSLAERCIVILTHRPRTNCKYDKNGRVIAVVPWRRVSGPAIHRHCDTEIWNRQGSSDCCQTDYSIAAGRDRDIRLTCCFPSLCQICT